MPILNRDEYFERVHKMAGTETSDETLSFIEDMTDTYNDMERRLAGDGEDWKKKYDELDAAWREKYKHRFYTSDTRDIPEDNVTREKPGERPEDITIDELFVEKEEK